MLSLKLTIYSLNNSATDLIGTSSGMECPSSCTAHRAGIGRQRVKRDDS